MYQLSKVKCEKYVVQLNLLAAEIEASREPMLDVQVFYNKLWGELSQLLKYVKLVSVFSKRFCGFEEYGFPAVKENTLNVDYGKELKADPFPFADGPRRETSGVYLKAMMDKIESRTALTFPKKWADRGLLHCDVYFGLKDTFLYSYPEFLKAHGVEDTEKYVTIYDVLIKNCTDVTKRPSLDNVTDLIRSTFKDYELEGKLKSIEALVKLFECGISLDVDNVNLTESQGKNLMELLNV